MDSFTWTNQDFLIVVAAGNDGVNGHHTVSVPATAKNILTVGASLPPNVGLREAVCAAVPDNPLVSQPYLPPNAGTCSGSRLRDGGNQSTIPAYANIFIISRYFSETSNSSSVQVTETFSLCFFPCGHRVFLLIIFAPIVLWHVTTSARAPTQSTSATRARTMARSTCRTSPRPDRRRTGA